MEVFVFLKVFLLGALVSTLFFQAKAASAAEIAALQAKVNAGQTLLSTLQSNADAQRKTLERAQADANSAWNALSAAEKKFQSAKSSFEKSAGTGIFGFGQGEGTPELRQALEDAQAARDKA